MQFQAGPPSHLRELLHVSPVSGQLSDLSTLRSLPICTHSASLIPAMPGFGAAVVAFAACSSGALVVRSRRSLRSPRERKIVAVANDAAPDRFQYGGSSSYWDNRYKDEFSKGYDTYDWLGEYDKFQEHIEAAASGSRDVAILDIGCGNARLLQSLRDDGYGSLTGADVSEVVIEAMRARSDELEKQNPNKLPPIRWVVGDVLDKLDFPDSSFDVIIDKSTMDAVGCDNEVVNANLCKMMNEISRVLKDEGTYIIFSGVPRLPRSALSMPHLAYDIKQTDLPAAFAKLSVFVCKKQPGANTLRLLKFDQVRPVPGG